MGRFIWIDRRVFDTNLRPGCLGAGTWIAADVICELDDTLHTAGIELCFAEMKDPVKDKLKRFGLFARFGEKNFFATLGEAVSAYREAHHIEWVDWKDRTP